MLETDAFALYDYDDCFGVVMGGNFEASLILVDSLWKRRLADLAPNGFPGRDTQSGHSRILRHAMAVGLARLREFVIDREGRSHPVTPNLYRRDAARGWIKHAN